MKITIAIMAILVVLFSSSAFAPAQNINSGKALYEDNCAECHGATGKGEGPAAATLGATPPDFTQAKFWRNNPDKKIRTAVEDGYGAMPSLDLKSDEIKAITDYMTRTFKK